MNLQILLCVVAIGAFATLVMDIGALMGFRAGLVGRGPRRQGLHFIGRWIGYLMHGKFQHEDILLTPPLPGEQRLGLITHYATGIGLALVYIALQCDTDSFFDLGRTCLRYRFGSLAMVPVFPRDWRGKNGASCLTRDGNGTGKLFESRILWAWFRPWSHNLLMNITHDKNMDQKSYGNQQI